MDRIPVPPRGATAPRLHHHPLAARHVFVAPQRAARPDEAALAAGGGGPAAWCPFCAGNEERTPPDILRWPPEPAKPWGVRIVANAFPVVTPCGPTAAAAERPAHGEHDLLIESATHERSILAVAPTQWRAAWELSRRRIAAFARRDDLAWATVFKNSGPGAGASLEHLHSQIVALDFVPTFVAAELAVAGDTADPFGHLIAAARTDGRVVAEVDDVVALVPPAPRQPFETWLLPAAPAAHFHAAPDHQIAAVADLTRWFVGRLERLAPAADFNWWLHEAPFRTDAAGWHWHLEIVPRLNQFAGFELCTGCHVTTLAAAEAAHLLREV